MEKEEIFEMVVREMTEKALMERREDAGSGDEALQNQLAELSEQAKRIMKKLPANEAEILEDYIVKTNLIADHDCAFLYVQGAKDCVELLQKLGVL
ncbi:MAG: hypothetical protein RR791_07870 [Lachnospiraceae bacterium]